MSKPQSILPALHIVMLMSAPLSCGRDKEPACEDRTNQRCPNPSVYDCDTCGQSWACGLFNGGGTSPVWGRTDWPCECIDENGYVLTYDSADTSVSLECI